MSETSNTTTRADFTDVHPVKIAPDVEPCGPSADTVTLDSIREALASSEASIRLVYTFTHGRGAQVSVGRRKVGPIIFPTATQTLADVLAMLGHLAEPVSA